MEVSSRSFSEAPSRDDPAETLKDIDGEEKPEVAQRDPAEEAEDDNEEVEPVENNISNFHDDVQ